MWFGGGLLVGVAVMARLKPNNETTCCRRVAAAARGQIGDTFGPWGAGLVDWLGLEPHLPGIIDAAGVPIK